MILFLVTLPILGIALFAPEHSTRDWVTLLLSGALGIGVADTLFFASLNRLGAANSAVVDCLYSPFVVLCAIVYLHDSINVSVIAAMSLMAAAILIGTWEPRRAKSRAEAKAILVGVALGVVSMLLMAIGIVVAKPVLTYSDPWWATTVPCWMTQRGCGNDGSSTTRRSARRPGARLPLSYKR